MRTDGACAVNSRLSYDRDGNTDICDHQINIKGCK